MTALGNKQISGAPAAATDPVARAHALHQRALALEDQHRYEEAVSFMLKAVSSAPHLPEMHLELALFLLRRGEMGPGLLEYEWRWRLKERAKRVPNFGVPQWNGMRMQQGTIVLHADQGAGDKIQFCRYIPMVAERCKELFITSTPATAGLLRDIKGVTAVISDLRQLPPVDVY